MASPPARTQKVVNKGQDRQVNGYRNGDMGQTFGKHGTPSVVVNVLLM
jgi:hypothetical protein